MTVTIENFLSKSALSTDYIKALTNSGLVEHFPGIPEEDRPEFIRLWYMDRDGQISDYYRDRYFDEGAKYVQPKGTAPRLYYPSPASLDEPKEILIVEGEKKALAASERLGPKGLAVVGIGGCWSWKSKRAPLADWSEVPLEGMRVWIIFDSDSRTNSEVSRARNALAAFVMKQGGKPMIVDLPPEHKGLDDWFLAWGDEWEVKLRECFSSAKPGAFDYKRLYDAVYTFNEMMHVDFPIPEYTVGDGDIGLVGQGMITVVHGPSNCGKTYLTTQLACSIGTGEPFLGFDTKQGTVLYLQGELPPGLFRSTRLKEVPEHFSKQPDVLFYNSQFNIVSANSETSLLSDKQPGMTKLERMLDEYTPDVLVIDPLQSYASITESSNDQAREFLKRMKDVAMSRNMAIVIVDHDGKASMQGRAASRSSMHALRGASAKTDLIDTALGLRLQEDNSVHLSFDKLRYARQARPEPMRLYRDGSFFVD